MTQNPPLTLFLANIPLTIQDATLTSLIQLVVGTSPPSNTTTAAAALQADPHYSAPFYPPPNQHQFPPQFPPQFPGSAPHFNGAPNGFPQFGAGGSGGAPGFPPFHGHHMHMHHMPPPPPQKKEPACTRIHASDGTLRTTAFLTVYEIEQAARAVRCLRGVVIRDDGKEAGIIIKADAGDMELISKHPFLSPQNEEDEKRIKDLQQKISEFTSTAIPPPENPLDDIKPVHITDETGKYRVLMPDEPLPEAWSGERQATISSQIALFRGREVERKQQEQAEENRWKKDLERRNETTTNRMSGFIANRNAREEKNSKYYGIFDTFEEEKERISKEQEDQKREFEERLRPWLNREATRGAAHRQNEKNEEEADKRRIADKEHMLEVLANFNDTNPDVTRKDDFYYDPMKWWSRRKPARDREQHQDAMDEERDLAEEAQIKRRNEQAAERLLRESLGADSRPGTSKSQDTHIMPFKISLSGVKEEKPAPSLKRGLVEDDMEEEVRRPTLPVLVYTDEELREMGLSELEIEEKRKEEKNTRVKDIVARIPVDKAGLFSWNVRWEVVDEKFIDSKIKPFVSKKLIEILGVQEEDIIDFVLDGVRNKNNPTAMLEELEVALGEDAEKFLMKIWRVLIFEIELSRRP